MGMDIFDSNFQDVVEKVPNELWPKKLWLFNNNDNPNEGMQSLNSWQFLFEKPLDVPFK